MSSVKHETTAGDLEDEKAGLTADGQIVLTATAILLNYVEEGAASRTSSAASSAAAKPAFSFGATPSAAAPAAAGAFLVVATCQGANHTGW
jgi:hypothetical protein